jgi:heme-degrading monooxygenase HmoA
MSARSKTSSTSDRPLIARVWHGVTTAARADEYAAYLRKTGVRDCRATPGNRGVQLLRRVAGDEAHFTFTSFWESWEAIQAFAGSDVARARYYPEDRGYLRELDPTVVHYEVLER